MSEGFINYESVTSDSLSFELNERDNFDRLITLVSAGFT